MIMRFYSVIQLYDSAKIDQILAGDHKVTASQIKSTFPFVIHDDTISIYILAQFFTPAAWKRFQLVFKMSKQRAEHHEDSLKCPQCDKLLNEHTYSVQCDSCLEWIDRVCAGLPKKKNPMVKSKRWYCKACKSAC